MRITKFGHACLLVEEGGAKILIDPGQWSREFEQASELDAVMITHQHPDHLVAETIKAVLDHNPEAKVYADEGSVAELAKAGVTATAVHEGDAFEVAGVPVAVYGREHAVIHPDVPGIPNVGYLVAERLFVPGDAFTVPDRAVEILAASVGGPWLKIQEAIDYVRAVKPKVAIPVHDAVLSREGFEVQSSALRGLGQTETLQIIPNGETAEF